MKAPVITRQRRRPFLAPVWLTALFAAIAIAIVVMIYRSATTTTVIVTRHAEGVLGSIASPPLTPEGELRAQQLARLLGTSSSVGRIEAVYITDSRTTQQTVAPLAARLGITPVKLTGKDVSKIALKVLREHRGKAALIVTQDDIVSGLVRQLSGVTLSPGANEYGAAYIVTVPTYGDASVLKINY